jgi:hypothetical protein
MSAFDASNPPIMIWQPPLPPETSILVPADPAGVQVDLQPMAPLHEGPPEWLRESAEVDTQQLVALKPSHLPDAPKISGAHSTEGERAEGVEHSMKMLANLVAVNALLDGVLVPCKQEETAREQPMKKEEDEN